MEKALTLYELNGLVRMTIEQVLTKEYWVTAELSEVRESAGHCYMELVQKEEGGNTPVAKASAKCWRNTWMLLRPHFERTTGQQLRAGMKVMLRVYPQFHENFGFSWIITDIDPTYTIGNMARKRQEIIDRLKEEGVFTLNKELTLPMFAQRIAVISSATAAGYGDFCNQLTDNEYGFTFNTCLFTAVMQGEQVEQTVISALNRINAKADDFDCVVIIRGGGATSDLSGFDTLALAENVANFPLPIITGIGHERDESVIDMVSHLRVKTPTAAAAFLISHLLDIKNRIDDCKERIVTRMNGRMQAERMRMEHISGRLPSLFALASVRQNAYIDSLMQKIAISVNNRVTSAKHHLDLLNQNILPIMDRMMMREKHRMEMICQRVEAVDPVRMLHRGYSITLHHGKAVRDPSLLNKGDEVITRTEKGLFISIVKEH